MYRPKILRTLLLFYVLLTGCTSEKTHQPLATPAEQPALTSKVEDTNTEHIVPVVNKVPKKQPAFTCQGKAQWTTAYPHDTLLLCAYDYDTLEKTMYEFEVRNLDGEKLLEGRIPTKFRLESADTTLRFTQLVELPKDTSMTLWYLPLFEYEFTFPSVDGLPEVRNVYLPSEELVQHVDLKIKAHRKYQAVTGSPTPYPAIEKHIPYLLLDALQGSKYSRDEIFELYNEGYDGALGEVLAEYTYLLNISAQSTRESLMLSKDSL